VRAGVVAMLYHGGHYAVSRGRPDLAARYFALANEIVPGLVPGTPLFKRLTRIVGPVRASRLVNLRTRLNRNVARAAG